jgi:type VI protein secretion system component Hcp
MKTTRLILSLAAFTFIAATSYAPDFAVLLGSGTDDSESPGANHKDWIPVQTISWELSTSTQGGTGEISAKEAPAAEETKGVARRGFAPVVLKVPVEGRSSVAKKAFTKGRKLGTIRLRDGDRILVLHGVVVADVTRSGATESISLSYTKIENATVPERAKERIQAGERGRAPD